MVLWKNELTSCFDACAFAEVKAGHEVGGDGSVFWIYENARVCVFVEVNAGHNARGDGTLL